MYNSPWRSLITLTAGLGAAALAACATDTPTNESAARADAASAIGTVAVCHLPGSSPRILEIAVPALADHLSHGDYVTTLLVSHDPGLPADGVHFGTIGDALAAARAARVAHGELTSAACRVTISVAPGTFQGTAGDASGIIEHFPLIVDVPDITFHGALVMGLDGAGRATGVSTTGSETTLSPTDPLPFVNLISTPIVIANAHPGGSAGNGLRVEGFVFQSGHDPAVDAGGQGVLGVRTTGLTIQGNRFEGGFTETIDLRAGSAEVLQNHLSGTAGTCDICLAGPGTYRATGNRLLAGGIPGITVDGPVGLPVPGGVEPYVLPAAAETFVELVNNEISDHNRIATGVGIRLDALGIMGPNVQSTIHATVRDNVLTNNRFGIIVHGAFPKAGTLLRGDIDATFSGNVIEHSCQAKLLVSLSRHTAALGLTTNPYLQNSTFRLALGGDVDWNDAWYSHPDGFGNTLIVDGQTIPNGSRQFYDATGCPGLN